MITISQLHAAQKRAGTMIRQAGILMTADEQASIQAADFGLSHLESEGAQILTFVATPRISVKMIVLFPGQTLPEHWHPPVGNDPGKEETFRVIAGILYLYLPGDDTLREGVIPEGQEAYYTVRHETILRPADQITIKPGIKHWLQAGPEGVVVYSFSTCVRDGLDGFSNPDIVRETRIVEDLTPGISPAKRGVGGGALKGYMRTQIIILDDDPTGIQTVHGCLALTCWDAETLRRAFDDSCPFFYVLTNTRAYAPDTARRIVTEAIHNILTVNCAYQRRLIVISRSDSTLRSHFPLEIDIITQLIEQEIGRPVDVIFVAPAFFEGGRITRDDTHYLWDGHAYVPTADTEFARDAVFGYTSSHLPTYIAEKTKGQVHAQDVRSLTLDDLRRPDGDRITPMLASLQHRQYVVVNAEQYADLARLAESVLVCIASGKTFVFQSAASLVKALTKTPDQPLLGREIRVNAGPGLIVVGSHVHKTSVQLQCLLTSPGVQPIEINVDHLLAHPETQRNAVFAQIAAAAANQQTPVVYTSRRERRFDSVEQRLQAGQRIADFLAAVVKHVPYCPSYLVAKGGITSHVILMQGLCVAQTRVLGQILSGVPVVSLPNNHRFGAMPYIIFPGNVGDEQALHQVWQCLA